MQITTTPVTASFATTPPPSPEVVAAEGAGRPWPPRVIPRGEVGTVTGRWVDGPPTGTVATEYGRGSNGRESFVVGTAVSDLYYAEHAHAVRAASILSEGAFRGAVSISYANFVGAELRRLGVDHGTGAYEFESVAQTRAGRESLERTLKVHGDAAIIDGAWAAVRVDEAGNVRVLATADYLAELKELDAAPAASDQVAAGATKP